MPNDQCLRSQIAKATSADIPRLFEIRASVRENILSDPNSVTSADVQWFIDHSTIWVWKEDGQILGFSAGDPRDGSIFALFVHPDHEGRGIGQALISMACSTLQNAGFKSVTLGTEPGTRAEFFYRKNGWVADGEKPNGEILFRLGL